MWRYTAKRPKIFGADAVLIVVPALIFLVHIRLSTLKFAAACIVIAWLLARRGITPAVGFRRLRRWIYGPVRTAGSPTTFRDRARW